MHSLSNIEIERYGRQLIIPEFGIESQVKLKNKKALIIGCGGLGCPAALYLSCSGIGTLGLIDNDTIELSNIQRQIAYETASIKRSKSQNLAYICKERNNLVNYIVYEFLFEKKIALSIVKQYDIVLDCTDNAITRYLVNDVCVLLNKPLVSGSALKFEGQLTVYNYLNGPCYRCLYSKAPSPEMVSNCSDVGVIGPIVGTIGSFQALEAIKILTEIGTTLNGRMLIFDGFNFQIKIIKLRSKQSDSCIMCQKFKSDLSEESVNEILDSFDYHHFCGVSNFNDKSSNIFILDDKTQRITCTQYKELSSKNISHLLIDVRPVSQFKICSLPNSINIPIDEFHYAIDLAVDIIRRKLNDFKDKISIYVVCRRGNDSQLVVEIINKNSELKKSIGCVKDIMGGLEAWTNFVDRDFPKY